jgi:hypothetical protein
MSFARRSLLFVLAVVVTSWLSGPSVAQVTKAPNWRQVTEAKEVRDAAFALLHTWRTSGQDIKSQLLSGGLLKGNATVIARQQATKYHLTYYVAWDASTVYVAFRGSTEPIHTATLALALSTPYGVHPGLNDAALTVLPEIKKTLAGANISGKSVVITGHSMGGVLATYVAHNLMLEGKRVDVIATFGSPRHAQVQFKVNQTILAGKKGVRMYSVENLLDWAPKSTPWMFQERIGHAINYVWTGDVHSMDTYYAKADETYRSVRASIPTGRPTLPRPPFGSRPGRPGR